MSRRGACTVLFLVFACGAQETGDHNAEELIESLPASVPAPEVEAGILMVTPERVRGWQEEGEPFVLIDARDAVQFGQEHLPGAVNIPYVDIRPGARLPQRNARIVVYCSDLDCPISQYAYQSLESLGYSEVYDMRAGLQGWKAAGYPTEINSTDN